MPLAISLTKLNSPENVHAVWGKAKTFGISEIRRAQRSRETHQAPRRWTHDGDGRCSALAIFELLPSNSNTHLMSRRTRRSQLPGAPWPCPVKAVAVSPGPGPRGLVRPRLPLVPRTRDARTHAPTVVRRRLGVCVRTHTHHSRVPSSAGAPPPQTATLTWSDGLRGSSTLRRPSSDP